MTSELKLALRLLATRRYGMNGSLTARAPQQHAHAGPSLKSLPFGQGRTQSNVSAGRTQSHVNSGDFAPLLRVFLCLAAFPHEGVVKPSQFCWARFAVIGVYWYLFSNLHP